MGVDNAEAIQACEDGIRALRSRLDALERRKRGLFNVQDRMAAFQSDHYLMVSTLRGRFGDVQFAGRLSDTLSETLVGSGAAAADAQVAHALELTLLEISRVNDEIEAAQRRKTMMVAQG